MLELGPQANQFLHLLKQIIFLVNDMEHRGELAPINRGNGFLPVFFKTLPQSPFFAEFLKGLSELNDPKHPQHAIFKELLEEHEFYTAVVMLSEDKASFARSISRELGDCAPFLNNDRITATRQFIRNFDQIARQDPNLLNVARLKVFEYYRDLSNELSKNLANCQSKDKHTLSKLLNEAIELLDNIALIQFGKKLGFVVPKVEAEEKQHEQPKVNIAAPIKQAPIVVQDEQPQIFALPRKAAIMVKVAKAEQKQDEQPKQRRKAQPVIKPGKGKAAAAPQPAILPLQGKIGLSQALALAAKVAVLNNKAVKRRP